MGNFILSNLKDMKFMIVFVMLIATVLAQGGGHGISKSTWASSDPRKCAAFFEKYLPAKETQSECTNGKCECATQGRYTLDAAGGQGPWQRGMQFGIHTVNCTF